MYPWSFLCEEAKIKQDTFSKKEFPIPDPDPEQGIPDLHAFCMFLIYREIQKFWSNQTFDWEYNMCHARVRFWTNLAH